MQKLNFSDGTFVVIATGEIAKIFTIQNGSLRHEFNWAAVDMNDDGPSGKRPPESSPRETDEATFSKQIAERLYKLAHKGTFNHLILVADPETLGEIRPLLHQEVVEKIVLEHPKTLINSPVEDIAASLGIGADGAVRLSPAS